LVHKYNKIQEVCVGGKGDLTTHPLTPVTNRGRGDCMY